MKRFVALVCAVLAVTACSKQGAGSASGGKSDGVLRVANWAEPKSLNPLLGTNTAELFIDDLMFNLLVTIDDHGNEYPDLAAVVPTPQNGGISKNGLTVTYHLRRNVKWHDGAPFTSADVKFSWQAMMNPANNIGERHGYDQVASVDTPDRYTVVFHLKQPFAPFVDTVFGESDAPYGILPEHLLGKLPNINHIPFNAAPIGTGPFKFVRWLRGDHVELAANPDYFRGKPKLSGVRIYAVPDDNTKSSMLRSHGADLINNAGAAVYHNLTADPSIKGSLVPSPNFSAIVFNYRRPPLDDLRVRQAIAYAIDKRRLIATEEFGTAVPAVADLSDFYWAYDHNLSGYEYDAAKANALLDAAGWRRGPNGLRMKSGKILSLQLVYGQGSIGAEHIAVQVQASLKNVGIDMPIKTYNYTTLYASYYENGILSRSKFDLAIWSWVSGADPDNSSLWMCDQVPPKGNNNGHYCDSAFDAAQRVALTSFDRAVRKREYATAESLLVKDAPAAFLFYARLRYVMNPALQNFKPNGISEGWNAEEWSI